MQALFCLERSKQPRKFCIALSQNPKFDMVVMVLIIFNTLWMLVALPPLSLPPSLAPLVPPTPRPRATPHPARAGMQQRVAPTVVRNTLCIPDWNLD